jgi:hypothetical protein
MATPSAILRPCTEDEARELHELAFPGDIFPTDLDTDPEHDHHFWVAYAVGGRKLGFCSAVHWPGRNAVFLSRAAVFKAARHSGLHRQMIFHRVLWAWGQGVDRVVTYTTLQNYPSMVNLLDSGFRFYQPDTKWVGNRYHYFQLKR